MNTKFLDLVNRALLLCEDLLASPFGPIQRSAAGAIYSEFGAYTKEQVNLSPETRLEIASIRDIMIELSNSVPNGAGPLRETSRQIADCVRRLKHQEESPHAREEEAETKQLAIYKSKVCYPLIELLLTGQSVNISLALRNKLRLQGAKDPNARLRRLVYEANECLAKIDCDWKVRKVSGELRVERYDV